MQVLLQVKIYYSEVIFREEGPNRTIKYMLMNLFYTTDSFTLHDEKLDWMKLDNALILQYSYLPLEFRLH